MGSERGQKFTELWIKGVTPPAKGQKDYYDSSKTSPHGFGVRVSQGGSKTFFLMYTRDKKRRRWTIGRYPDVSLSDARRKASRVRSNDDDPAREKRRARELGSFRALAKKFLAFDANLNADNDNKLRSASAAEYRRILDEVIKAFGDVPAAKLQRSDLREYLEKKAEQTPYMANRIHAVVRRVYNWAKTKEHVETNPCDGLERPGGKESERDRVLSTDEIRSVWEAIEKERPMMAAYFKLLFLTGVRRSEARTACWADIDLEQRLWRIPLKKSKNKMAHEVPLSDQTQTLLKMLWPLTGHTEHVFIGPNGRALTSPQKAKERIAQRAKVPFRIHDIRRTVATQLAAIGVPSDTISAILNHKIGGIATTRIYMRYERIEEKRAALDKWARHVEQIVFGKKEGTVVPFGR